MAEVTFFAGKRPQATCYSRPMQFARALLVLLLSLVSIPSFAPPSDEPQSGSLGRGWRVFFPNSQGLGDKGLRVPVERVKQSWLPSTTQSGKKLAFRWFFQRIDRPNTYDYEPRLFQVWLQRLEDGEVASEELLGRWTSPLGTWVNLNAPKHVQWSPDLVPQLEELGLDGEWAKALQNEVLAKLRDGGAVYAMFFPHDGVEFLKIRDPLEFSPRIEFRIALERLHSSDSEWAIDQQEERIRRYLRTLSKSRLARIHELTPEFFSKLGRPDFHLQTWHFAMSSLTIDELREYLAHGTIPARIAPEQSRGLLPGALLGGVASGLLVRLAMAAGLIADPQMVSTVGLAAAAGGLTVASFIGAAKMRWFLPRPLRNGNNFRWAAATGFLGAAAFTCGNYLFGWGF